MQMRKYTVLKLYFCAVCVLSVLWSCHFKIQKNTFSRENKSIIIVLLNNEVLIFPQLLVCLPCVFYNLLTKKSVSSSEYTFADQPEPVSFKPNYLNEP